LAQKLSSRGLKQRAWLVCRSLNTLAPQYLAEIHFRAPSAKIANHPHFQEPNHDLATEAFKQHDRDYGPVSHPQSGVLTSRHLRNWLRYKHSYAESEVLLWPSVLFRVDLVWDFTKLDTQQAIAMGRMGLGLKAEEKLLFYSIFSMLMIRFVYQLATSLYSHNYM